MTIKEARIAAGMSQAQVRDELHIPIRTLSQWETGTRKPPEYVEMLLVDKFQQIAKTKSS